MLGFARVLVRNKILVVGLIARVFDILVHRAADYRRRH